MRFPLSDGAAALDALASGAVAHLGDERSCKRGAVHEHSPSMKALAFDVFGTVVDWRSSVIAELGAFGEKLGLQRDWPAFADNWRAGYVPAMARVRRGELPWTRIDDLHRAILVDLLDAADIRATDAEIDHLNRAWHRLDPWPDSVAGLARLKQRYLITTLSNGNVSLLTNMAKTCRTAMGLRDLS